MVLFFCLSVTQISPEALIQSAHLVGFAADDPSKDSVQSGAIWRHNTFNTNTFFINREHSSV